MVTCYIIRHQREQQGMLGGCIKPPISPQPNTTCLPLRLNSTHGKALLSGGNQATPSHLGQIEYTVYDHCRTGWVSLITICLYWSAHVWHHRDEITWTVRKKSVFTSELTFFLKKQRERVLLQSPPRFYSCTHQHAWIVSEKRGWNLAINKHSGPERP